MKYSGNVLILFFTIYMLRTFLPDSKKAVTLLSLCALTSVSALMQSCSLFHGSSVSEKSPENVLTYYASNIKPIEKAHKYSAFFDFSGVYIAYNDPQTAQTFNGITQKITGSMANYDLYSLANEKIEKLNSDDLHGAADIFAKLHNPEAHGQLYAPIEKTLQQIVHEDHSALLVTDFEEYTPGHHIYRQAYATPYFEEWLKRGKDITFFVTDYIEGSLPKHLYYVVFDDERHLLLAEIEAALKGKPENYKRFTLSMHNYSVEPKAGGTSGAYAGPTVGGTYHDQEGTDVVCGSVEDGTDNGYNHFSGYRAELYTFGESWESIVENARGQQDAEIRVEYRFRHLFQNLYADFSNTDSYKVRSLNVCMTDIGEDFDTFMCWRTAMLHKPKVTIVENEKQIEIPSESEGYYDDETGKLLAEYDYPKVHGQKKPAEILGVVEFDNDLFTKTFTASQGKKTELAVNLNPKFSGIIAGNEEPSGFYRIDITVNDAEPNIGEQLDVLFAWPGNSCLSDAIRNVLQHCNPKGSAVYSYFIRMDQ